MLLWLASVRVNGIFTAEGKLQLDTTYFIFLITIAVYVAISIM